MLPRSAIVLAIVLSAAVMTPLRRAQRAFGTYAAGPRHTATARPSLRRRLDRAGAVSRQDTRHEARHLSTRTTVGAAVGRRGRRDLAASVSAGARRGSDRQVTAKPSPSFSKQAGPSVSHGAGDCVPDRSATVFPPEPIDSSDPIPRLVAATQVVDDIPDPPPRHSTL